MTSKHEIIAGWLAAGLSTTEAATIVGCSVTYARAVRNRVRNKKDRGFITYASEAVRRRERYLTDPEHAASVRAQKAKHRERRKHQSP